MVAHVLVRRGDLRSAPQRGHRPSPSESTLYSMRTKHLTNTIKCNRKISQLLGVALIFLLVCVGCVGTRNLEESKSISIPEHLGDTDWAYVDSIIQIAHEEVNTRLLDPNLTFFSYSGECAELLKLNEQYTFMYIESSWQLLDKRTYRALVVINLTKKVLVIKVDDVSEHYLSVIPLEITGEEIINAARIAQSALQSEGKCENTIVLSKSKTEGPWGIRCGKPDEVYIECMEIDLRSGTITIK
jgi:hypothetical protein